MSDLTERTSAKISNMSFVCALLVVMIHVDKPQWSNGLVGTLVNALLSMAVPYFFAVSGYFMMNHADEPNWWQMAVRKRFGTLVVPYFFWLLVGLVVIFGTDVLRNWLNASPLFDNLRGFCGSGRAFFGLRLDFPPGILPLWYLRCLIVFVFISPFTRFCVEKFPQVYFLLLICLTALVEMLFVTGLVTVKDSWGRFLGFGLSVKGLLYFSFGVLVARGPWRLQWPKSAGALVVLMASLVLCCYLRSLGVWCEVLCALTMPPCLMMLTWRIVPSKPIWKVTRFALPVFLVHAIVFEPYWVLQRHFHVNTGWSGSFLMLSVGVIGSVLVAVGLRGISSRVSAVAFGGRL